MSTSQIDVDAARLIAEKILWPRALEVDASGVLPAGHLQALADAGFYGAAGPREAGGLDLDQESYSSVVELVASGCLSAALVWIQHHGLVRALRLQPDSPISLELLEPLCRGTKRSGVVLAGLYPGEARLTARRSGDSWVLQGTSPWVSGWGLVDVLHVAARLDQESVVWLVVDAVESNQLKASRQHLVAANASSTVELSFSELSVPVERLVRVVPYHPADFAAPTGLAVNGSMAMGVIRRCLSLIGPSALDLCAERARTDLAQATGVDIYEARAAASELAMRAAAALVVHQGSRAAASSNPADLLARQALLLLVFGARPAIKESLLRRLGASPSPGQGQRLDG